MKKIILFLVGLLVMLSICSCASDSSPVVGDWFSVQLTDGETVVPYGDKNALSIKSDGTLTLLDGDNDLSGLVGTWEENKVTSSAEGSISYIVTFRDTESDATYTAIMMYQVLEDTPTVYLMMDDYMISFEKKL